MLLCFSVGRQSDSAQCWPVDSCSDFTSTQSLPTVTRQATLTRSPDIPDLCNGHITKWIKELTVISLYFWYFLFKNNEHFGHVNFLFPCYSAKSTRYIPGLLTVVSGLTFNTVSNYVMSCGSFWKFPVNIMQVTEPKSVIILFICHWIIKHLCRISMCQSGL